MARPLAPGGAMVGRWMVAIGQRSWLELMTAAVVATSAVVLGHRIPTRRAAEIRTGARWLRRIAGDPWLLTRHPFDGERPAVMWWAVAAALRLLAAPSLWVVMRRPTLDRLVALRQVGDDVAWLVVGIAVLGGLVAATVR